MSEDDNSASASKDKDSTLLLTKDGQRYYVSKSGVVDSRNVTTPHEPDHNASSYDADDPDEESDVLDTSDPRDGAASPEELNDEETSEGDNAPKQCTYEGCTETSTQVAKQRKPWMCKKHRNKMYKDKYKKKKSDQAMSSGKLDENSEERPVSVNKQRLGAMGDRPARPSLIEQVLNQKRLIHTLGPNRGDSCVWESTRVNGRMMEKHPSTPVHRRGMTSDEGTPPANERLAPQMEVNRRRMKSLLRSPEVISFLQQQQQLLAAQGRSQSQQQFQGC